MSFYIAGYDITALIANLGIDRVKEISQYAVSDASGAYHGLPGLSKDGITIDGLFDDNYHAVLTNLFAASTGYQVVIPLGTTLGDQALAASEIKLPKLNWKSVVTDVNKLSAELVAENCYWEECQLLQAKATKTTDGNGTGLDNADTSADGLIAYLQVFSCGADDALIVKVQSDDNANFDTPTDKITFTAANGITTERKTTTGTIERYLRVTWSGTPSYSASFAVVIKR